MRSPALPETLKVAQALVFTLLAPSFQGSLEGPVPARFKQVVSGSQNLLCSKET
jgi:hypothetical protein